MRLTTKLNRFPKHEKWSPAVTELRRQLRVEMTLAGYRAADLYQSTDDVIDRELTEAGHDACVCFLGLWVRSLREENRAENCVAHRS